MPKATDITRALFARLQGITQANGYLTDIGQYATRGVLLRSSSIQLPVLCLHSITDTDAQGGRVNRRHTRTYQIEAILQAGELFDEQQDAVLHDLRRALIDPSGVALNGLALEIRAGTAELDDPEIGSECALVRLTVTVDYTETYAR
jgi:hypothetical protein